MFQQSLPYILYQNDILCAIPWQLFPYHGIWKLLYSYEIFVMRIIKRLKTKYNNCCIDKNVLIRVLHNSVVFLLFQISITFSNYRKSKLLVFWGEFQTNFCCCWVGAKNKLQLINFAYFVSPDENLQKIGCKAWGSRILIAWIYTQQASPKEQQPGLQQKTDLLYTMLHDLLRAFTLNLKDRQLS